MRLSPVFSLLVALSSAGCLWRKYFPSESDAKASLGEKIFVSACISSDSKNEDVLLAQALMAGVGTKDCSRAWELLQETKSVMLSGYGLRSLKLLSLFPHMEEVSLNDNFIEDLSPIHTLKGLSILDVSFNQIRSLKGIEGLMHLKELRLAGNRMASLALLSSVPTLRVLDVSENTIEDIKALSSLSQLEVLILRDNDLVDVTPLKSLHLLSHLALDRNRITSVIPLADLKYLTPKRFSIDGNPIKKELCPTSGESAPVVLFCLAMRGASQ